MNSLENISYDKLKQVYSKYFTFMFLDLPFNDKLACIALTCYITNELRKKDPKISCYDVLLKIGKDMPNIAKNTLFKSLGAICEDFLKSSSDFPDFGIPTRDMPKQLKKLLSEYCPF